MMKQIFEWLSVNLRERARWRGGHESGDNAVRVFYGFDYLPGKSDIASGGIVKFQDIQSAFPNITHGANILYIASSALPPYAPLVARIARSHGCRIVINQNGVAYPAWSPEGWESQNKPMREVLAMADHVFYQSRFCRAGADRYLGAFSGSSEILYNPVDTSQFVPAPADRAGRPPTLLLSGSHCQRYRVASAIQTVAVLARRSVGARLIVAGRYCWGDDEAAALAESMQLAVDAGVGDCVEFMGAYAQKDAVALLQRADILLHTKYNDPCPRLVIEAMSCGLPVVFSASGGLPELVAPGCGEGVAAPLDWQQEHPPEPEALADCVQKILADYRSYSLTARRMAVERFDVAPWIRRHEVVFEGLISGDTSNGGSR